MSKIVTVLLCAKWKNVSVQVQETISCMNKGSRENDEVVKVSKSEKLLSESFEVRDSGRTCAHGHGCPGYHPHGSHSVVAWSRYRDWGGVQGCGGDAVRLHHGGVMDHMWLSRIHWLGVVRSLSGGTQERAGEGVCVCVCICVCIWEKYKTYYTVECFILFDWSEKTV